MVFMSNRKGKQMKLTRRGKNLTIIIYTIIMTLLCVGIYNKFISEKKSNSYMYNPPLTLDKITSPLLECFSIISLIRLKGFCVGC